MGRKSTTQPKRETSESLTTELESWACAPKATLPILSTDIVGSTAKNRMKGDRRWPEMLKQHHNRVAELVSKQDGKIFKDTGDGFLIAFRTAMDAMVCALELRASTGNDEIAVRASIHVGAVRIEPNDIRGVTVNFTCRMAKWTKKPLVVLSNTAKEGVKQELGLEASEIALLGHCGVQLGEFGSQTLWVAGYFRKNPTGPRAGKRKPTPNWFARLIEETTKGNEKVLPF